MTRDELLEHINKDIDQGGFSSACGEWFPARSLIALRAVVELHKPDMRGNCDICSWVSGGFVVYAVCPTIQTIEKELNHG